MLGYLARVIGLILYVVGIIYLTQRNCENPPQHEGGFVRNNPRIKNVLARVAIPLLGLGAIVGLWGYVPFREVIAASNTVAEGRILSLLLKPVLFLVVLVLAWIPSMAVLMGLLWRLDLKPSLLVRAAIAILLLGLLFSLGVFLLDKILKESLGAWFGSLEIASYTWIFPLLVAALAPPLFLIYIFRYWAVELLPLRGTPAEEERRLAAQYLYGFFSTLPRPTYVVEDGELKERIKGNLFLGTGPGLVITGAENIVAVRDSGGFRRFVGSGGEFIGVEGADIPYTVIDLQKQFRATRIDAMTRDGILVNVPCSSLFRIDAGDKKLEFEKQWPYRERAAFLALHAAQEVNPAGRSVLEEHESSSWKELPLRTAKPRLEQLIAGYTLDELYATQATYPLTRLPRQKITKKLRTYVREQMAKVGVDVQGGGVGASLIPKDKVVVEQRVDTWKAGWAKKLELQEGKATAVYLRESERVRIRILNELIELARELGETSVDNKKMLLYARLLEMLENIARNPEVERLVPEQRIEGIRVEERQILQDEQGDS